MINKLKNTDEYDLMKFNRKYLHNHILPQYKYIESEKYKTNFILKFENLNNDFKDKTKCVNLINEIYRKDFEMFDYEMKKHTC